MIESYVSKFQSYVSGFLRRYNNECFLGLDKKKIRDLELAFSNIIGGLEEYNLPESYYVDRQQSFRITDVVILQNLVEKLKRCIEIRNPFEIDYDTMSQHPIEARFFYRVYQRKFREFGEKFAKINPFPEKSEKHCEWERARLLTCEPPVFKEYTGEYSAWNQSVMRHTWTCLSGALKLDEEARSKNNNLLLHFTYVEKQEKELKKKALISLVFKAGVALGIIYGLGNIYKRFIR